MKMFTICPDKNALPSSISLIFRQPSIEGHLSKLSNGSGNKFGSTPLFSQIMQPLPPPPPQNPAATSARPPRLPTGRLQYPTKHSNGCPPNVPASISCHENIIRNDYSIPGGSTIPISHSLVQPIQVISGQEGFYAATDIVSKVRNHEIQVKYHIVTCKRNFSMLFKLFGCINLYNLESIKISCINICNFPNIIRLSDVEYCTIIIFM